MSRRARSRSTVDRLAGRLAGAGASLGIIAGLTDVAFGPSMRSWVGNKLDTSILGIGTIALSSLALIAALAWRREASRAGPRRIGISAALAIPGLVCFTTIGRLWYVPGAMLLTAALAILANSTRQEVRATCNARAWLRGLLVVLGAFYVFLGADALGVRGGLGMAGGLLIWAALARGPSSRRASFAVMALAALPFAIATWWSVVTPLMALLIVGLAAGEQRPRRASLARNAAPGAIAAELGGATLTQR